MRETTYDHTEMHEDAHNEMADDDMVSEPATHENKWRGKCISPCTATKPIKIPGGHSDEEQQ